jgi:hypothetical protein
MADMIMLAHFPFLKSKFTVPQQIISTSWADREKILCEDVNLFCWNRSPDPVIKKYLLPITDRNLQPIRYEVNRTNLQQQIEKASTIWDNTPSSNHEAFWNDIFMLIHDFLGLSDSESGTIYLQVIHDNACTKFHVDGYSLRLFTTYFGKGTEWLPEKATNRKGLGRTNELIVKDFGLVRRMAPFVVGILKGEKPGLISRVKGIVHRSPEIESEGEKRIILRVDI